MRGQCGEDNAVTPPLCGEGTHIEELFAGCMNVLNLPKPSMLRDHETSRCFTIKPTFKALVSALFNSSSLPLSSAVKCLEYA